MKVPEDSVKHAACLIDLNCEDERDGRREAVVGYTDATHYKRSSDVWNT